MSLAGYDHNIRKPAGFLFCCNHVHISKYDHVNQVFIPNSENTLRLEVFNIFDGYLDERRLTNSRYSTHYVAVSGWSAMGIRRKNVEPFPGSLSIHIDP